jgi:uncharacterized protein YbgA (DUF1722 family)/uncharacterized protein YbbK (DUF523 family)
MSAGAASPAWERPRLVLSACLELEACRYNGQSIRARYVPRLAEQVELLPVCPEVEIGLGVPRAALRLVALGEGEQTRLLQPATGRDLTGAMRGFSDRFLDGVGEVDGFLLKSRSPSCGPKDVKVYTGEGNPRNERDTGHFAAAVAERHPLAAIEDEGRLTNYGLRHHFLTRLFQGARLRALPATPAALVEFHASSKLLLLAHSEVAARELGRIVANHERLEPEEVRRIYREGFARAMARPPRTGALINALMHAAGHFSPDLVAAEKRLFLETLREVRSGRGSLTAPLALLRGWMARHGAPWVEGQTLFHPYPAELHDLADSAGDARVA